MMFVNPVVSFFFSCFLQRTLVGLVRDLRGIAFAFNAKTSFMMLFDWMYPFSRDTVRLLTARWTVTIFIIHHSRSENVPERRPADIQPTCPFCSEPSSSGTTTQHAPRPSSNSWPSSSTTGELSDPDVSCRGSFTSGVSKPSDTVKDVNRFKSELSNHHHHNNFYYCSLVHFGHSEWKSAIFIIE